MGLSYTSITLLELVHTITFCAGNPRCHLEKKKKSRGINPPDYDLIIICYPPKESSLKNSTRGPFGFECLSFTFCYFDFILTPYDLCHLLWWVGGWWVGRIFPPIYLIFWYVNKQNVLISNMFSTVLYGFYIKSYEPFLLFLCWQKYKIFS